MNSSRKIWKCLGAFLLVGTVTFTSCKDKNNDPFNATVDVFVQRVKTETSDKVAVALYTYGNRDLKTVKATAPGQGAKVYDLAATAGNKQIFSYLPVTADYVADMPTTGAYSFEVTAVDNSKLTLTDQLGAQSLAAINFKTAAFADGKLKSTWDALTGAENYTVKLFSADGNTLLYVSPIIASSTLEYSFNSTTLGWLNGKAPVVGTDYLVQVLGVKYEDGVSTDKAYNIQFISLASKTIKWQ
ncbi:MAG: hypothetical protein HXX14_18220 [Bacteroidetes bacterium]|nr:hypothetical protein [Bacteroidota bacterium]